MSALVRSRPMALVLTSVPGWGHVYWGRENLGLGIFTVFAVAGFVLFNALYIYIGSARSFLIAASLMLICATALWAWVDIVRATSPRRVRAGAERRNAALIDGMVAYLRGDLAAAKDLFDGCIKTDPADVEALFRLGVVCGRSGDARQARLCLRRARKHDWEEKWRWEIARELERLKAASAPGDAAPDAPQRERAAVVKQEA